MARLDVHAAPGRRGVGYVVNVQSDLLSELATRVVIPLFPEAAARVIASRLNPVFEIEGQRCVLMTQGVATVPRHALSPAVTSLNDHHDTILAAMDFLMTGF